MGNLFEDIRERFLRINDKLVEFINIQNEREDEIKVIEDETNKILDEHNKKESAQASDFFVQLGNQLDSAYSYASQIIDNIHRSQAMFDPKVPNTAFFQQKGMNNANVSQISYSMDYQEDVRQLEWIDEQISRKTSICAQSEGSLFAFGKKLAGLNDSLYEEIYTLFYQAYAFYDGLEAQFDRICEAEKARTNTSHKQYFNNVCRNADVRVAEIDKIYDEKVRLWQTELIQFLEENLPISYIEQYEKNH